MNIVVCLKQVPDTEASIRIRADGQSIDDAGLSHVMNYYDEHAVEAGLRLREQFGGSVTLLSAGPARAAEALRTGLAMGADEAILINDPALEGADHLTVAVVLAAAIRALPHDVVICGKLSTDDNAGVVGPALAEYLGLPQATAISKLEVSGDQQRATAHREIEGAIEILEVALPALFTVERSINEPRYPSLPGIMKAKRKEIKAHTLASLGVTAPAGARVALVKLDPPPRRQAGRMVQDDAEVAVREIIKFLRDDVKAL